MTVLGTLAGVGQAAAAECTQQTPSVPLPPLSCDGHVHVFNPDRFAYVPERSYTPGPATVADLRAFLSSVGLQRVVLVQPSGYGSDNRCLLDALQQLGPSARGVAVVGLDTIRPTEVDALHAAGVRAIRLNLEVKGESRVAQAKALIKQAADVAALHHWAIQVYVDVAVIQGLADTLAQIKSPVVFDHYGGLKAERGPQQAGLSDLFALMKQGPAYVKLSAPYRASKQADFADLAPFVQAFAEAAPDRLVWASDWPHTGSSGARDGDLGRIEPFRVVNNGQILDQLRGWIGHAPTWHQLLVTNAARLYHFER